MKSMKKVMLGALFTGMLVFLLAACGNNEANDAENANNGDKSNANTSESSDDALKVVTSFTIIADVAREIGGEDVDIHNLVPTGTDPHEYEPLPEDIKKASDADVLFYNGLNLEGGQHGWFMKLVDSVGADEDQVYSLTNEVDAMYIGGDGEHEEEKNPHSFINPANGIIMAEDMRDALMELDPDNAEAYQERGDKYINRLQEIHDDYAEKLGEIPEENRYLVTSERAFQYLADEFDLEEGYIWEVDTEENGTPKQIKSLVEFLKENDVPILFVESNVDERPMETVSNETGIDIYDKPIYSDEIGKPGDVVDTYVKYLNYNIDVIYNGLTQNDEA